MNRVAEDGVLTSWFQKPQKKYGTSYRIINLIVGMQLLTIILSGGNVYVLAGLYAFGVIWSFALKSLAVLVLRYTEPGNREWKVPGNLHIGGREVPLGLIAISAVLLMTALVNLFTKSEATIAGVTFSAGVLRHLQLLRASCGQRAPRQTGEPGPVPRVWKSGTGQR